ncbi:MAG: RNA methyltransferase [Sandaracinaceae bacterium]|nr:RNA methyltransferase [Sandaracinaceae bacterium]
MTAWIALVHHPVVDREGALITTAITNLDVHDIARSARTYDLPGYFLVTPIEAQRRLVERILGHWRDGAGARRVPERAEALARVEVVASMEEAAARVEARAGAAPLSIVTSARAGREATPYVEAARRCAERPAILWFGTGHGLAPVVMEQADLVLPPIRGVAAYNHLSVRAAVAITLDRLFGGD